MILLISLISLINAEIRINEIELNPNDDCSDCTEWLELYSDEIIDLSGWKIVDASNNTYDLNFIINGYYIIENISVSLNNNNEQIFLYDPSELIDQTEIISDSGNDLKSWQYCDGEWEFLTNTKNSYNDCGEEDYNEDNNENEDIEEDIELEALYNDEDFINGDEFEIKINAQNLKDKEYDVKIWIVNENNNIISERYDDENEWKSGTFYINDFFNGPGEDSKDVKIRIKRSYADFFGDAILYIRIRDEITIEEDIEILEQEDEDDDSFNNASIGISINNQQPNVDESVIILGGEKAEDIKTKDNIVYKSKIEYVKEYAIYGFSLLCIILIILLLMERERW